MSYIHIHFSHLLLSKSILFQKTIIEEKAEIYGSDWGKNPVFWFNNIHFVSNKTK